MAKKKDPVLEELMCEISRAEGRDDGCLTANFSGTVRDIAAGTDVTIQTDESIDIFNVGVTTGIRAILNQLCEQGYTIIDPNQRKIQLEEIPTGATGLKKIPFGESHKRWLVNFPPSLSVVK